jgi:hypothetical protein
MGPLGFRAAALRLCISQSALTFSALTNANPAFLAYIH